MNRTIEAKLQGNKKTDPALLIRFLLAVAELKKINLYILKILF